MVRLNPFLDLDDEDNESLDGVLPLDAPAAQELQEGMLADLTDREAEVMDIGSLETPQADPPEDLVQTPAEVPAPQLVEDTVEEAVIPSALADMPEQAVSVDMFGSDLGGSEELTVTESASTQLSPVQAPPQQTLEVNPTGGITAVENASMLREDVAVLQDPPLMPDTSASDQLGIRLNRLERNIIEEAYMPLPIEHGPLREGPGVG